MSISVCLASYNGNKFIRDQIVSILKQLNYDDEIIVVDDFSTDNTVELISSFNEPRIRIYLNKSNLGHVKSFARAISYAKNEFIFLSDQDDIWVDGRVLKILNCLSASKMSLLTSNSAFIDKKGLHLDYNMRPIKSKESNQNLLNILRIFNGSISYYGCTMAFNRKVSQIALPIPAYIESHDLWIALIGNISGSNIHIDDVTIYRRIHGNNSTDTNRSLSKKIYSRLIFLISVFHVISRICIFKVKFFLACLTKNT